MRSTATALERAESSLKIETPDFETVKAYLTELERAESSLKIETGYDQLSWCVVTMLERAESSLKIETSPMPIVAPLPQRWNGQNLR